MNDSLNTSRKFKRISVIIFFIFLILTIILVPVFAYLFNDYWLLFGILFAIFIPKFRKLFVLISVSVIIYWIIAGFQFSDKFTFFWFSSIFGLIFQSYSQSYDDLASKIIQNEASEITSNILNGIKWKNKKN